MKAYYHARAAEYDDWWQQRGLYAERWSEAWQAERDLALDAVAALPAKRTLDVACGTGFVTRLLAGEVVGLDQSAAMLNRSDRSSDHCAVLRPVRLWCGSWRDRAARASRRAPGCHRK